MTYNLKTLYTTVSELVTSDKSLSTIYGRRPSDGSIIPIAVDDAGNIQLGTGITLSAGDFNIGAVEIQDNDSATRIDIVRIGDPISLAPYNGSSDNYTGFIVLGKDVSNNARPMSFDANGSLTISLRNDDGSSRKGAQAVANSLSVTQATSDIWKVSGVISDTLSSSAPYVTTNSLATAASYNVRGTKTKTLVISNTGANPATITMLGSVDAGITYDVIVVPSTTILAGGVAIVKDSDYETDLLIQARSTTPGAPTTIATKIAMIAA